MRIFLSLFMSVCLATTLSGQTAPDPLDPCWQGKRVAFLGDSMTEPSRDGSETLYWQYLSEWMGIEPHVYGVSGYQWTGIHRQAIRLSEDKTDVDAIIVFAGTNDFNHNVPLGDFFAESVEETNHNGRIVMRKHRTVIEADSTFCGRINKVLSFLKTNFPEKQIIIMTPIHRGYAKFDERNVQPEENFANGRGLYLDDYVEALKKASGYWSCPLIDLHSISGLYPLADSHAGYFRNADTDRLHLNSRGNERLARAIGHQLRIIPPL
jgi:lysophospholipase L1-like esterase